MLRKITKTIIKEKSITCDKCGKKIAVGAVKKSDGSVLCGECNEEQSDAKTQ